MKIPRVLPTELLEACLPPKIIINQRSSRVLTKRTRCCPRMKRLLKVALNLNRIPSLEQILLSLMINNQVLSFQLLVPSLLPLFLVEMEVRCLVNPKQVKTLNHYQVDCLETKKKERLQSLQTSSQLLQIQKSQKRVNHHFLLNLQAKLMLPSLLYSILL